jgi:broad specificity phosphatase PhoE
MKTIYFVRHGESEANVRNILNSTIKSEVPLTEKGRGQAALAGENLKGIKIDHIICSPFLRTIDTAKIISDTLGFDSSKIIKSPFFVERDFGIFDGHNEDKYHAEIKLNGFHESVETTAEMHKRVTEGLDWIKSLNGRNIILVSHGATGRMVQAINDELPHHQMHTKKLLDNTEVYDITI